MSKVIENSVGLLDSTMHTEKETQSTVDQKSSGNVPKGKEMNIEYIYFYTLLQNKLQ